MAVVVSTDAVCVTASLSLDVRNGLPLRWEDGAVMLSEERVDALQVDGDFFRSLLTEGGVGPVTELWVVGMNAIDEAS
jgi:hypothetical protein